MSYSAIWQQHSYQESLQLQQVPVRLYIAARSLKQLLTIRHTRTSSRTEYLVHLGCSTQSEAPTPTEPSQTQEATTGTSETEHKTSEPTDHLWLLTTTPPSGTR